VQQLALSDARAAPTRGAVWRYRIEAMPRPYSLFALSCMEASTAVGAHPFSGSCILRRSRQPWSNGASVEVRAERQSYSRLLPVACLDAASNQTNKQSPVSLKWLASGHRMASPVSCSQTAEKI